MCLNYWNVHPNFFCIKTSVKMSKKSYYSKKLSDAAKYLTWNQLPCRTVPPPTVWKLCNPYYHSIHRAQWSHSVTIIWVGKGRLWIYSHLPGVLKCFHLICLKCLVLTKTFATWCGSTKYVAGSMHNGVKSFFME